MRPKSRFYRKEGTFMLDLLIQNARIVDGTGMPAYYSHVGIREGKIAVIAPVVR